VFRIVQVEHHHLLGAKRLGKMIAHLGMRNGEM